MILRYTNPNVSVSYESINQKKYMKKTNTRSTQAVERYRPMNMKAKKRDNN